MSVFGFGKKRKPVKKQWCDKKENWIPYSTLDQSNIEVAFQSGKDEVLIACKPNSQTYVIHIKNLIQTNATSETSKRIK